MTPPNPPASRAEIAAREFIEKVIEAGGREPDRASWRRGRMQYDWVGKCQVGCDLFVRFCKYRGIVSASWAFYPSPDQWLSSRRVIRPWTGTIPPPLLARILEFKAPTETKGETE